MMGLVSDVTVFVHESMRSVTKRMGDVLAVTRVTTRVNGHVHRVNERAPRVLEREPRVGVRPS
jgi:hypothetical protein